MIEVSLVYEWGNSWQVPRYRLVSGWSSESLTIWLKGWLWAILTSKRVRELKTELDDMANDPVNHEHPNKKHWTPRLHRASWLMNIMCQREMYPDSRRRVHRSSTFSPLPHSTLYLDISKLKPSIKIFWVLWAVVVNHRYTGVTETPKVVVKFVRSVSGLGGNGIWRTELFTCRICTNSCGVNLWVINVRAELK